MTRPYNAGGTYGIPPAGRYCGERTVDELTQKINEARNVLAGLLAQDIVRKRGVAGFQDYMTEEEDVLRQTVWEDGLSQDGCWADAN